MKHTIAKIKDVLAKFWSRPAQVDYLEVHYSLLDSAVDSLNEEELARLMAERELLKKRKKKWSHIQTEIERLKAKQILNQMRRLAK